MSETPHAKNIHFLNTTFSFKSLPISVRVGQVCKQLDDLLDSYKVTNWVYLSAANPNAEKLDDETNASRQKSLYQQLKQSRVVYFEGVGKGVDWQEPGFFVFGMDRVIAERISKQWGQVSFVYAPHNRPAELVYT